MEKEKYEIMKKEFPQTFGMTFEEYKKRISTKGVQSFVKKAREKFNVDILTNKIKIAKGGKVK